MKSIEFLLEKEYGFEKITLEKDKESTEGNVYIISSKNFKSVLKIYEDIQHVKSMICLHNDLVKNDMYVPKIITSLNGDEYIEIETGKYIVVYTFLTAKQLSYKYEKLPNNIIYKIAKELRKFHDITLNNNYGFKNISFNIETNVDRCSALHFDLTRSNIFCTDDDKCEIGFIDFDDAKYGNSICDVAIAITNLFFSKTRGVDINGLNIFIDSYYEKDLDLKNKELKYVKTFAISWINYIMAGNNFDSSTVESFDVRKNLIEKNL